jgi:hypothetical protein
MRYMCPDLLRDSLCQMIGVYLKEIDIDGINGIYDKFDHSFTKDAVFIKSCVAILMKRYNSLCLEDITHTTRLLRLIPELSVGNSGPHYASFEACGDLYIKVALIGLIRLLSKEICDDGMFKYDPVLQAQYAFVLSIDISDTSQDTQNLRGNGRWSPHEVVSDVLTADMIINNADIEHIQDMPLVVLFSIVYKLHKDIRMYMYRPNRSYIQANMSYMTNRRKLCDDIKEKLKTISFELSDEQKNALNDHDNADGMSLLLRLAQHMYIDIDVVV